MMHKRGQPLYKGQTLSIYTEPEDNLSTKDNLSIKLQPLYKGQLIYKGQLLTLLKGNVHRFQYL